MAVGTIKTLSGRLIDPFNMKVEDINIYDIAHSLSMQCRYNGHVKRFYSVAEHSVLVSQHLPEEHKLWGLLHDATETYIGDMVSPVKQRLDSFNKLEDDIHRVVAEYFDLPVIMPDMVHRADKYILMRELEWIEAGCVDNGYGIVGLDPEGASTVFLNNFNSLMSSQERLNGELYEFMTGD